MKLFKITLVMALVSFSSFVSAENVVIVHPSNGSAVDAGIISRLYLGKAKSFPSGEQAVPVNQAAGAVRESFDQGVLGKSASQLQAYWSKLVFTGKGSPPKDVGSDAEVIALISANPNMIGYVSAASADASVKVVHSF